MIEDYAGLNSHEKGYKFEREIRDLLVNNGFSNFECNDLESMQTWYRSIGKGADFKFHINGKRIEAEAKYLDERSYRSWVLRDYIPRFSFAPNTIPIIVSNNKFRIAHRGREELKLRHIKIMNQYQFIWYLFKLSRKRGNKYIWYRNSVYYNISDDQSSSPEICTDLTTNTTKITTETTQSSQIQKHSLDHKHANLQPQDDLSSIWIALMASLLPLLKYINQYTRKVRNTFGHILSNLYQILLAPTMLHVKHILRIKLNDPSSTEFLSIPSMASEYTASSPLCSITPLFYINQSSVEFYHTGTSGVPWLQEDVHRLI